MMCGLDDWAGNLMLLLLILGICGVLCYWMAN